MKEEKKDLFKNNEDKPEFIDKFYSTLGQNPNQFNLTSFDIDSNNFQENANELKNVLFIKQHNDIKENIQENDTIVRSFLLNKMLTIEVLEKEIERFFNTYVSMDIITKIFLRAIIKHSKNFKENFNYKNIYELHRMIKEVLLVDLFQVYKYEDECENEYKEEDKDKYEYEYINNFGLRFFLAQHKTLLQEAVTKDKIEVDFVSVKDLYIAIYNFDMKTFFEIFSQKEYVDIKKEVLNDLEIMKNNYFIELIKHYGNQENKFNHINLYSNYFFNPYELNIEDFIKEIFPTFEFKDKNYFDKIITKDYIINLLGFNLQEKKNQNFVFYGLDFYLDDTNETKIKKIFNYIRKYPNINSIQFLREEYPKLDIKDLKEELLDYTINIRNKINLEEKEFNKIYKTISNLEFDIYDKEITLLGLSKDIEDKAILLGGIKNSISKFQNILNNEENIYLPLKENENLVELSFNDIKSGELIPNERLMIQNIINTLTNPFNQQFKEENNPRHKEIFYQENYYGFEYMENKYSLKEENIILPESDKFLIKLNEELITLFKDFTKSVLHFDKKMDGTLYIGIDKFISYKELEAETEFRMKFVPLAYMERMKKELKFARLKEEDNLLKEPNKEIKFNYTNYSNQKLLNIVKNNNFHNINDRINFFKLSKEEKYLQLQDIEKGNRWNLVNVFSVKKQHDIQNVKLISINNKNFFDKDMFSEYENYLKNYFTIQEKNLKSSFFIKELDNKSFNNKFEKPFYDNDSYFPMLYKTSFPSVELNAVNINFGNKLYIDLFTMLNKQIMNNFFSLNEIDMTQKNIIWYLFKDIKKIKGDLEFKDLNKINYLNLFLQLNKVEIPFLQSNRKSMKINNVYDYYEFMIKTKQMEDKLKRIIETIVTRVEYNIDFSYIPENYNYKQETYQYYFENGKINQEELEEKSKILNKIYKRTVNDLLKFDNGNDLRVFIINTIFYTYDVFKSWEEKFKSNSNKSIEIKELKDTKEIQISNKYQEMLKINKRLVLDVEECYKVLVEWFELNNQLLYSVSPVKVEENINKLKNNLLKLVNIEENQTNETISKEEGNIRKSIEKLQLIKYTENGFIKYNYKDLLKDIEDFQNDNDYLEFLEYSKGYFFTKNPEEIYHMDMNVFLMNKFLQKLYWLPKNNSSELYQIYFEKFKKMDKEVLKGLLRDMIGISYNFSDYINDKEKELLDVEPTKYYFEKTIVELEYSLKKLEKSKDNKIDLGTRFILRYEHEELINFLIKEKNLEDKKLGEKLLIFNDKNLDRKEKIYNKYNNFVYYYKKIKEQLKELYFKNKIDNKTFSKLIDKYIGLLVRSTIFSVNNERYTYEGKGKFTDFKEDKTLEEIYFQFNVELTYSLKELIIKYEDLYYLIKFEKEILPLIENNKEIVKQQKLNFEKTIKIIKEHFKFTREDFNYYNYNQKNQYQDYINMYKVLYYKIIIDYMNIEKTFKDNILIDTAILLHKIERPVEPIEYSKNIINIFLNIENDLENIYKLSNLLENKYITQNTMIKIEGKVNKEVLKEEGEFLNPGKIKSIKIEIQKSLDNIKREYKKVIINNVEIKLNKVYEILKEMKIKQENHLIEEKTDCDNFEMDFDFINEDELVSKNQDKLKELEESLLFQLLSNIMKEEVEKLLKNLEKININENEFSKMIFVNMRRTISIKNRNIIFNIFDNIMEKLKINIIYGKYDIKNETDIDMEIYKVSYYSKEEKEKLLKEDKKMILLNNVIEEVQNMKQQEEHQNFSRKKINYNLNIKTKLKGIKLENLGIVNYYKELKDEKKINVKISNL